MRAQHKRLIGLLFAWLLALAALPTPAHAQENPASWRAITRFEDAPDGAPIAATVPDLNFSASDGAEWRYGDVRSGRYNAPYPLPCPDFGGPCAFAVRGNGFAWLGETPGIGRIDIGNPTVTSFSAGFSTAERLTVSAFSVDGAVLGEQTVAPNLATGRLDPATLTAPAGRTIAYVLIRGGANRWIMDDLVIGSDTLPPRPGEPVPAERPAEPALVTVVQRTTPNLTAAPDSRLSLVIEVVNRGRGAARDAVLTLVLNPQAVTVLDASFSVASAWVSDLTPTAATIRTGALPAGASVMITLDLYVLPTATLGAPIGGALTARWADAAQGGVSAANLPVVVVGAVSAAAETLPLTVTAQAPAAVTLAAAFFAPQEPVGLWYDHGDGMVTPLATVQADAGGSVTITIDAGDLPPGGFFVAEGHWSGLRGVAAGVAPVDS